MTFFVQTPDEEEEAEESEGEVAEVSLDDDLLAELDPLDDAVGVEDALTEGFGEVPEEEEKALDKVIEKGDNDDDSDENLEEDAEDVDFDRFDDVDEM